MQLFLLRNDSEKRKIYIPNDVLSRNVKVMALKNSVPGGQILTMSTDGAAQLQLGQAYASITNITSACYAINRSQFNMVDPKPDWYDGLNGKFKDVQSLANEWLDDYAITLRTEIPSSITTFVPSFDAITGVILNICKGDGELTQGELSSVKALLEKLLARTNKIYEGVKVFACCENDKVTGDLVDWGKKMEAAQVELNNGVSNIQKAVDSLKADIAGFNQSITSLENDISKYNKFVSAGAGLVGGGTFLGIAGAGVCFLFPVIGGIMIAVGVASVIGGATTWGVFQQKINSANDQITQYKQKIKTSNQTLVALGGLNTSVNLVVESAKTAVDNMSGLASSWATFGLSIRETIQALDEGNSDDIKSLLVSDINEARAHWENVKVYADKLSGSSQEIQEVNTSQVA